MVEAQDGTLPPVATCPEEAQVKIQHLPEYKYDEQLPRDKVLEAIRQRREERERLRLEQEQKAAAEQAQIQAQLEAWAPFIEKWNASKDAIQAKVLELVKEDILKIEETFLLAGSWCSKVIVDAVSAVFRDDDSVSLFFLEANDIDTYISEAPDDDNAELCVDLRRINYISAETAGLDLEVNTVGVRQVYLLHYHQLKLTSFS